MSLVILSLGSNLGDREGYISSMIAQLNSLLLGPLKQSRLMETEPVGVPHKQQNYLNCIISGTYKRTAIELLKNCELIETSLGRTEKSTKKARTADIDILFFGHSNINNNTLTIPHPETVNRRFCIEGINEIAPEFVHPILNKPFKTIFKEMPQQVQSQQISFL